MPRAAPVTVAGGLLAPTDRSAAPIPLDSIAWREWLRAETNRSFAYRGERVSFTARRERQRNGWYWYAYRRVDGRVRKLYLGRSEDLTLDRLRAAEDVLAAPAGRSAAPLPGSAERRAVLHLIATKLHPPSPRPALVARQRLLAQLDAALLVPLTVVVAPAGFGKSTLLASWIAMRQTDAAGRAPDEAARPAPTPATSWVSLDAGDGDPVRFWAYVAVALRGQLPGFSSAPFELLHAPQPPPPDVLATAVLNALAAAPREVVLVLDDYHLIESPAVHESLALFVARLPSWAHLVLAGRSDPPLPLPRFRARGQLVELRAADLRFTPEETAAFLSDAMGLDLPDDAVAALERRTEGWAAALQLAALSVRGRADAPAFIAQFAGSHRAVVDYLAEEVIGRQPPAIQQFLLYTAVLDRMCAELCDALLGPEALPTPHAQPGPHPSRHTLAELERANLFLIPLDDERRWFRYHHLFGEMLRDRLARQQPDLLPTLHGRAAAWYRAAGLTADAVEHLLAAGDYPGAAALIAEIAEETLWRRGEAHTLLRWIASLPPHLLIRWPRLGLVNAWVLTATARFEDAERQIALIGRSLTADQDADAEAVHAEIAAVHSVIERVRGNIPRAIELAELARDRLPPAGFARSMYLLNLVNAYSMAGDLRTAARLADDLVKLGGGDGAIASMIGGLALSGVRRDQGRLREAFEAVDEVRAWLERRGVLDLPAAGLIFTALAEVSFEWNNLDAAERYARAALARADRWWNNDILGNGHNILGWIALARGDEATARGHLERGERLGLEYGVPWITRHVLASRAHRNLALGDLPAAIAWARGLDLTLDDDPAGVRYYEYAVLVRVAIAEGRPAATLPLLDRLRQQAIAGEHTVRTLESHRLRALALHALGQTPAALAALADSLALAWPESHVRTFLGEGEPMHALLRAVALRTQQPEIAGYAARLLAEYAQPHAAQQPAPPASRSELALVEPLSPRELDVLRLIAAGRDTREIASALVVAVSTVRSHIKSIYGKLGARSRIQAVERGRSLGLL